MQTRGFKQLLVLDVPDFLISPTSHIGHELTQTPIWIPLAELRDGRE
jgi:hypothetical protein